MSIHLLQTGMVNFVHFSYDYHSCVVFFSKTLLYCCVCVTKKLLLALRKEEPEKELAQIPIRCSKLDVYGHLYLQIENIIFIK